MLIAQLKTWEVWIRSVLNAWFRDYYYLHNFEEHTMMSGRLWECGTIQYFILTLGVQQTHLSLPSWYQIFPHFSIFSCSISNGPTNGPHFSPIFHHFPLFFTGGINFSTNFINFTTILSYGFSICVYVQCFSYSNSYVIFSAHWRWLS